MYVLEATKETQGERDGGYVWTIDGELVVIPPLGCRTRDCGCDRGFAGMPPWLTGCLGVEVEVLTP